MTAQLAPWIITLAIFAGILFLLRRGGLKWTHALVIGVMGFWLALSPLGTPAHNLWSAAGKSITSAYHQVTSSKAAGK